MPHSAATTEGKIAWEWRTWDHLDPETNPIVGPQDKRQEWTHANSEAELPDGNLLVSSRNASSAIIDRASGEVIWMLGARPHPRLLTSSRPGAKPMDMQVR